MVTVNIHEAKTQLSQIGDPDGSDRDEVSDHDLMISAIHPVSHSIHGVHVHQTASDACL
jgi:hypothetical protein